MGKVLYKSAYRKIKKTKESSFDVNQQGSLGLGVGVGVGVGVGLGLVKRATLRHKEAERATLRREARRLCFGVPRLRKGETDAHNETQNGGRDG